MSSGLVLRIQTLEGAPLEVGGARITPLGQAILLRLGPYGWMWQRPQALRVQRGEHTSQIPIIDLTRLALLALLLLPIGLGLVLGGRAAHRR